jgi:hypothetical protein
MAPETPTLRRILQFKFTLPGASAGNLASFVKASAPFYEAFGGARVRLLQNADDPSRYIHEIAYEAPEALEINRQRVASDPRVQAYLQAWRMLVPGAIEIDVYQDVTG